MDGMKMMMVDKRARRVAHLTGIPVDGGCRPSK
jgi:hypothetical protein